LGGNLKGQSCSRGYGEWLTIGTSGYLSFNLYLLFGMHTEKFSAFLKKALPAIKHQSPKLMLAPDAALVFVAAKSV